MSDTTVHNAEDANPSTLYFILTLQILLVLERVFSNVFKRIKRCQCSDCCTMNMGDSTDTTPQRAPTPQQFADTSANTPVPSRERKDIESVSSEYE
jgi:hypothetical protein